MINIILAFYVASDGMSRDAFDILKTRIEARRPEDHMYFYVSCPGRTETYIDCVYPRVLGQQQGVTMEDDTANLFLELQQTIHEQQNQDNFLTVDKPKQFKISKKKI